MLQIQRLKFKFTHIAEKSNILLSHPQIDHRNLINIINLFTYNQGKDLWTLSTLTCCDVKYASHDYLNKYEAMVQW